MTTEINPASSPVTTAPLLATAIAERQLGNVDWVSPNTGYCQCPGLKAHSTNSGKRDCVVYLDHVPTIYCVHASCATAVDTANRKLRAAILNPNNDGEYVPRRLTAEDKARLRERERCERIRKRAAKALPELLANHPWPYAEIIASSPMPVMTNEPDHWRLLLQKFRPDDVVWIGDKFDSGKPEHAAHFKTATEWMNGTTAPGPFICPVAFKNTGCARTNDNVVSRRFLVVESDTLSRDEVGSVFKWLCDAADLSLVAIVDTGGKSLHGWFKFEEDLLDEMKLVLPAFQCDPKLFTPSQPVRLPGALRDGVAGRYQKLVYLSAEVAHV